MPIKVACSCGRSFAAPDHLAGRAVKCPNCSQPLNIPAAAQPQQTTTPAAGGLADLLAEEGLAAKAGSGPQCPSCSAPMPPHGFICVQCGYNVQLGRRIQIPGESANTPSRDAQQLLAKANRELKDAPQSFSASDLGSGVKAYIAAFVLLIATVVIVGAAAAFFYLFGEGMEDAGGFGGGLAAMVFGGIVASIGGIWIVVMAFLDEIWKGVLCLVCGIYFLFYLFSNFSQHKVPAMLYILGSVMQGIGYLVAMLSGPPGQ